jgi:predicted DNA-binding transcriptional regulator YafY
MAKTKEVENEKLNVPLELLRRIPRNRSIKTTELQAQLEAIGIKRDIRSIQRQLNDLCRQFPDIQCDPEGRANSYSWKENSRGFFLPSLSPQESLILNLAERYLDNLLPPGMKRSMKTFFDQARINLGPVTKSKTEREWLKKVRVVSDTQPRLAPKIQAGVFEAVSEALYANQWIEVKYRKPNGEVRTWKVMPLGLAQQEKRLNLVVQFDGYTDYRYLALHRMQSVINLKLLFERPSDFDLEKYDVEEQRFGVSKGKAIHLKFWASPKVGALLVETPLSEDQEVETVEDGLVISATVMETEVLIRWLRGFGKDVRDIEPKTLSSKI